jgi:DNA polymerase II small subunit
MDLELKKEYVAKLLEKNILIEPGRLNDFNKEDFETLLNAPSELKQEAANRVVPKELQESVAASVKITYNYQENVKKKTVQDFVSHFNKRLDSLQKILRTRFEMINLTSISKILNRKEKSEISIIGLISSISKTKNGHVMLSLEDQTGSINVLINKNRDDLIKMSEELVLDEVIGISGTAAEKIVFSNKIVLPDVPRNKALKKSPDEAYAVFLSDLHVGSDKFLPDKLNKFLDWLNGDAGSEEQKAVSSKVKYMFVVGDLVDGVGIFPEQESELEIKDIYKQYEACTEFLRKVPEHIHLIICPGNHDAVRISEPQPIIPKEFAQPLHDLPNAIFVTSPGYVNIHATEKFPGFDVLVYHGYSFPYYADKIESLRNKGGVDRIDLVMKFLLQKRHLAPSHTSTLYIPDIRGDPFVVSEIPDFFITGHVHKVSVSNFRSTTLICSSCWQEKTSFQEKLGVHPEPARVPIVNLQTREVKILRF